MSKWLMSWLTMKRKSYLFTDQVSGHGVWLYVDKFGDEWMANYFRFGFRCRK